MHPCVTLTAPLNTAHRVEDAAAAIMHVLMLLSKTFRHDPRVYKEARALLADGHAVTVLEWARHDPDQPATETVDGVRVVRFRNTPAMARLPSDLFRNPLWWRHAARLGAALHEESPVDVVHCHDLDTLAAGVRLKRRLGIRLVFDAHEIFRKMVEGNVPWPVPQAASFLEHRLLRHVDLVVTASERFGAHYAERTKAPVVVVWNCFGDPPEAYVPPEEGPFTVGYIGTLSRDRLFPGLVDALGGLDGVRFVVGGKREGVYAETEAAAARHDNVTFLGPVPFDEVLPHTRAAHVVVSMLDPANPQYRIQVPNKLFDAMTTGRPLVATEGTETGRFVLEHDVGVTCGYDPQAVRAAVAALRDDPARCRAMGERGQTLARRTFHWSAQAERLTEAYRRLAQRRAP